MSDPRDDGPKGGRDDQMVTAEMLALFHPDPLVAEDRYLRLYKGLTLYADRHGSGNPEDAAQETILRALHHADKIDQGAEGLRRFAYGIVKNVIREQQRDDYRETARDLDPLLEAATADTSEYDKAELSFILERLRPLLKPEEWITLLRYQRERDDHEQHCQELGVTGGYLRVMVHRLRRRLEAGLKSMNISTVRRQAKRAGQAAAAGRKKE